MGAWKLRALVYGMLAVVAALVLVARAEHESSADVPAARLLEGRTAHGGYAFVNLRHGRLVTWGVEDLKLRCYNGAERVWRWTGSPLGKHGTYFLRRDEFDVHLEAGGARLWMHARVSRDRRRISGQFDMTERFADGTCSSGPVAFVVAR